MEDYDRVVINIATFNHDNNWDCFDDIADIYIVDQYLCAIKESVSKQRMK